MDISAKATEFAITKSKEMPVIIFCDSVLIYKEFIPQAKIFAGNEVGELNALLKFCRTS